MDHDQGPAVAQAASGDAFPRPVAPDLDALLAWIEERAAAGDNCPTNAEIAMRFGLRSTASSVKLMQLLEAGRFVRIIRMSMTRKVILRDGRATWGPMDGAVHWTIRRAAARARAAEAAHG